MSEVELYQRTKDAERRRDNAEVDAAIATKLVKKQRQRISMLEVCISEAAREMANGDFTAAAGQLKAAVDTFRRKKV